MTKNSQLTTPTQLSSSVNLENRETLADVQFHEVWSVLRGVLVVWAFAVWILLIMMPGVEQIYDAATAMLHLPNVFMGLGIMGAIFASYNLRSDGHMLWFLGVLLLIAGWM